MVEGLASNAIESMTPAQEKPFVAQALALMAAQAKVQSEVPTPQGQSSQPLDLPECVTGDTLLKRRKKKKRHGGVYPDDQSDVWEDVPIVDITPGDEILSLNEITGQFQPARVNKLLKKGIQTVFKVKTIRGKSIRTTAEHPYLVRIPTSILTGGVFEIDQSNRIEQLNKDSYVSLTRGDFQFVVKISRYTKRFLYEKSQTNKSTKTFAPLLFARAVVALLRHQRLIPDRLVIDIEYPGYEDSIVEIIRRYHRRIDYDFRSIGKSSPAHIAAYGFGSKRHGQKKSTVIPFEGTIALLHPESTGIRNAHGQVPLLYHSDDALSTKPMWQKVSLLKIGWEVATVDGWEQIISIEKLGQEKVYDIEVESTHNFVGNGIVAHNTMIARSLAASLESAATVKKAFIRHPELFIDKAREIIKSAQTEIQDEINVAQALAHRVSDELADIINTDNARDMTNVVGQISGNGIRSLLR